jgi:CheY-like chemotaxis protein
MNKVLIVDDQQINRKLPLVMLSSNGFACVEACSGEEALEILAADPGISHVLLDVSMPGMSGIEVCRLLRARLAAAGQTMRIIAYTAHAFADEKAEIMSAGFDDLLIKPITRESLHKALGIV